MLPGRRQLPPPDPALRQRAVTAAIANWLILRRATKRWAGHRPAPPEHAAKVRLPVGPALIDETDDAGGHRIYLNPWAADDEADLDEEPAFGLIEEYPHER